MPWTLSDSKEQKRLERAFSNRSIPFDAPGFCDHPAFLAAEKRDARFLELYARYVEARAYDEGYLTDAALKIRTVAEAVEAAIKADGRLGACVDASGMVGRMLDHLGIWNYVAKATLTVHFPAETGLTPRYFWVLDEGKFVASHAIVVAPPFGVVDVTVRHQPYDANQASHLPDVVTADTWSRVGWLPDDLANSQILGALTMQGIPFERYVERTEPQMLEVMHALPAREVCIDNTRLKYVVVAVGGVIENLEGLTGYKPCGRTALEIYKQDVEPRLTT
jgi:hypothetical protein